MVSLFPSTGVTRSKRFSPRAFLFLFFLPHLLVSSSHVSDRKVSPRSRFILEISFSSPNAPPCRWPSNELALFGYGETSLPFRTGSLNRVVKPAIVDVPFCG